MIQRKHQNNNVVRSIEFTVNEFVTEKHSSFSAQKIVVAVTKNPISDDSYGDINRKFPKERMLFLNVMMDYSKKDAGVPDLGIDETTKMVYSLSELTELTNRINELVTDVNNKGCHINQDVKM